MGPPILVAHEDPAVSQGLSTFLRQRGYECVTARDAEGAFRLLSATPCEWVVFGSRLDGEFGGRLAREFPATRSLRLEGDGAVDYEEALRRIGEEAAVPEALIGRSPAIQTLAATVRKLSASTAGVLILGESGTGQDSLARALHDGCPFTRGRPFVSIRCAGATLPILDRELFGRGAEAGTVFLDGIEDLDPGIQARWLQAGLGARLIGATAQPPRDLLDRKLLREDFHLRLAVVELRIPPLRERPEDLPDLAAHFIARFNAVLRRACRSVDPAAMEALQRHDWRGNLRELRNVVERALILHDGPAIRREDLPSAFSGRSPGPARSLREALRRHEGDVIRKALEECGHNRERAAKTLGIGVSSLYRKLRRHRLEGPPDVG